MRSLLVIVLLAAGCDSSEPVRCDEGTIRIEDECQALAGICQPGAHLEDGKSTRPRCHEFDRVQHDPWSLPGSRV